MLERSDKKLTIAGDDRGEAVGHHVLADMSGLSAAQLQDEQLLNDALCDALDAAGFQRIEQRSYKFPGAESGVTGVALLSESHAAFHTYPEYGYMAVDVFSCGDPDPADVIKFLADRLQPQECKMVSHVRGRRS